MPKQLLDKKNFKISDEDESVLGDCLDPCGVCVTKGQMRDGTLCNRLLLCCFAVVLLWASSFQTAVYIANSSISSPEFEAVKDSCDAAYRLSVSEKSDYVDCVDTQMDRCDDDFEQVLNAEVAQTNAALTANAAELARVGRLQEACSGSFTTAQVGPAPSFGPAALLSTCPPLALTLYSHQGVYGPKL